MEASALHAPAALSRISASGPLLRLRSDDQLVALFRMGYDEAFGVIHDRYRRRLFAYTRQMLGGSRSDAEDALQDVFLRAYGALRSDARPVTLRAWLYRVAHNRCIDVLRRPVPAPADLFEVSRRPLDDPLAAAERREDLRRLVADMRRLPEQQRSALLMRELEGLTYAELADALAVSIPAVKSLLVRARVGLVEAGEARDTACADIRSELVAAHDRGVRASGRSRRHLHDCSGCRAYKSALRGVRDGFGALTPGFGPLAALAKLLGAGGAGSGAAAGAGALGGGAATVTATKVAAIVCCAAVVGGGAVEVREKLDAGTARRAAPAAAPAPARATAAPVVAEAPLRRTVVAPIVARAPRRAAAREPAAAPVADPAAAVPADEATAGPATPPAAEEVATGGLLAPDEEALPGEESLDGAAATPAAQPAEQEATAVAVPENDARRPVAGAEAGATTEPAATEPAATESAAPAADGTAAAASPGP